MKWFRRSAKTCACGHREQEHTYLGKYCSGVGGSVMRWCLCYGFTDPTPAAIDAWYAKCKADRAAVAEYARMVRGSGL